MNPNIPNMPNGAHGDDAYADLADYFAKEADRHNRMGDYAKSKGHTVPTGAKPQNLKPDGSLSNPGHGASR